MKPRGWRADFDYYEPDGMRVQGYGLYCTKQEALEKLRKAGHRNVDLYPLYRQVEEVKPK
jgi:hypothetical protein